MQVVKAGLTPVTVKVGTFSQVPYALIVGNDASDVREEVAALAGTFLLGWLSEWDVSTVSSLSRGISGRFLCVSCLYRGLSCFY